MPEFVTDPPCRLPLRSIVRIHAHDAKLLVREDAKARWDGLLKQGYKCNVCIYGIREEDLLLTSITMHLTTYGRHPFHRGTSDISIPSQKLVCINVATYRNLLTGHYVLQEP
jgi:hypothetical protein